MKKWYVLLTLLFPALLVSGEDPRGLTIGNKAPGFELMGIDDQLYTLEDFSGPRLLMLVFTANHCPTAQAYEARVEALAGQYGKEDLQVVAISSNHPEAVCLEELGYSDLGDSFDEMKIRASDRAYSYPYLYDGDRQETALAYGAVATPHIFLLDQERILRYSGCFDDTESPYEEVKTVHVQNAVEALLAGKEVPVPQTKAFGCSMKWKSKVEWRRTLDKRWAEKEVGLELLDLEAARALVANEGGKLRLVNVWATWCGPCIIEFPEFVDMQRMYGNRNFEVVSISMDPPAKGEKVLGFLEEHQAAFPNYHFDGQDRDAFINTFDPNWQGNLPYTLILDPGGELLYKHDGIIDPLEVRRIIVGELGRFFADD